MKTFGDKLDSSLHSNTVDPGHDLTLNLTSTLIGLQPDLSSTNLGATLVDLRRDLTSNWIDQRSDLTLNADSTDFLFNSNVTEYESLALLNSSIRQTNFTSVTTALNVSFEAATWNISSLAIATVSVERATTVGLLLGTIRLFSHKHVSLQVNLIVGWLDCPSVHRSILLNQSAALFGVFVDR